MGLKKLFGNLFKKDEDLENKKEELDKDKSNLEEQSDDINTVEKDENLDEFQENKEEDRVFNEKYKTEELIEEDDAKNCDRKENSDLYEIENCNEDDKDFEEQKIEKKGIFKRLKEGLKKTSTSLTEKFDNLFKGYLKIDEDLYEEIEEILITSDISYKTTIKIVEQLRENIKKKNINDINLVKPELKEVLYSILDNNSSKLELKDKQSVIVIVGVNGVGKTTSIGKLALKLRQEGKSVLLAAGDTFRAAAGEQLEIWAKRAGTDIVMHKEDGADPSAVIFDAMQKAKSKNIDVLICDTAGRLHNKKNLMNELGKIMRTIEKGYPDAKKEVLLVIDATTGQNALNQVKLFNEAVNLTGVILTKLDGTAKGGVVLSIIDEHCIPVKFIGVGEKVEDLQEFEPKNFVDALFDI